MTYAESVLSDLDKEGLVVIQTWKHTRFQYLQINTWKTVILGRGAKEFNPIFAEIFQMINNEWSVHVIMKWNTFYLVRRFEC